MKVIIDTNVLVSAAITGKKPEAVILWVVDRSDVQWLVSEDILMEYKSVLSRPRLKLSVAQQKRWFDILEEATTSITVNVKTDFPRDQKDAKFLSCALASEADFLITGDQDFGEAQKLMETTIISVSLFQRLITELGE
ncbi:UNVERIFIED_CONTAM: putative toxin-antitoxin system toxin component, PIN family [Euhalothece sp. KZN 001]